MPSEVSQWICITVTFLGRTISVYQLFNWVKKGILLLLLLLLLLTFVTHVHV